MGRLTVTDLVGTKVERLLVISRAPDRFAPNGKKRIYWNCLCDCGNEVEVRSDAITAGTTKSCGCLTKESAKEQIKKVQAVGYKRVREDLSGKTFGRLTVVSEAPRSVTPKGRELVRWNCKCKCGNEFNTLHDSLKKGLAVSCGCVPPDLIDSDLMNKTEVFVYKAKQVHGDKYDYSLTEFEHSQKKVDIICSKHGVFKQQPSNHLIGSGCLLCANDSKSHTLESFIEKAKEVHQEGNYDYSKVVFVDYHTDVVIICKQHGEFLQKPSNHLSWKGCQICANEARSLTQEDFIKRAVIRHSDRYDYSRVVYERSEIPVEIVCKSHGSFYQKPSIHMSGSKCPKCSSEDRASKQHWDYIERCKLNPDLANSRGVLYLLKLVAGDEEFLKVGISSSFEKRLSHYREEGLSYKILKKVETSAINSAILEKKVLNYVRENNFKYIPNKVFAGWTECSSMESMEHIFNIFDEIETECMGV